MNELERRLIKKALYKKSFYHFYLFCFKILHSEEIVDSWHIKYFCDELQEFYLNGTMKRMSIECPPRILKSNIANVAFSVWVQVANDGASNIITYSANFNLSRSMNISKKIILDNEDFIAIFGKLTMADYNRQDEIGFNNGGRLYSGSVSGGQIGKGANLIIYDDLLSYETASSEIGREGALNLYQNSQTRFNDQNKKKIIIINQRLHVDDLIGKLEELRILDTFDKRIILPAIAPYEMEIGGRKFAKDELVIPERLNEETLDDLKINLGTHKFNAQYLQDPKEDDDPIFDVSLMKFIPERPTIQTFESIAFLDFADDGNDYVASPMLKYYANENKWVAFDIFFTRDDHTKSIPLLVHKLKENDIRELIIEKNFGGNTLAMVIEQECRKINYYPKIMTRQTTSSDKNKYVRISTTANLIMENIYFLEKASKMYNEAFQQMIKYNSKSKHDDVPDAFAILTNILIQRKKIILKGEHGNNKRMFKAQA